ncbi:MAG: sel1 repeat family protein [Eggerthellaceae bacterium]|nr:sel1 repeat family protein [Eggerthellaceae bacterium]
MPSTVMAPGAARLAAAAAGPMASWAPAPAGSAAPLGDGARPRGGGALRAALAAASGGARPVRRAGITAGGAAARAVARQSSGVPLGARASWLLFGSPSARRANGGADASLVPGALRGERWRARRAAMPVFALDRRGRGAAERLPRVWVTEPAFDPATGSRVGRELTGSYPNDRDLGGARARALADAYFGEALTLRAPEDAGLRAECFRAAEVLYLHAAERGDAGSWAKLGTIYRDDLGRGRYWQTRLEERALHTAPRPLAARAAECFRRGSEAGDAEACWALADLVMAGEGRPADPERAVALLRRAVELADAAGDEAARGNAALRLARACARGRGTAWSFEEALAWYEAAEEALGAVVGAGAWYFKRPLGEARRGAARMRQEIHGGY